jgi:hypothetical protein
MTLQELVNLLCNHLASVPSTTPVLLEGSNFSVVANKDDEKNLFIEIKKL